MVCLHQRRKAPVPAENTMVSERAATYQKWTLFGCRVAFLIFSCVSLILSNDMTDLLHFLYFVLYKVRY